MKTTLTRESASKLHIAVEATSDEVAPALGRAVQALGQEVKVPGFRKGHVPRKVLESRLGRDAVREATLKEAIPELLAKAVEDEELSPIAPPSVEVTSYDLDGALVFDAHVEVRPEFELPDLSSFSARRSSVTATPEEIEDQLGRLRERFATLETVERTAHGGDFILCDIHTTLHGTEIDELSGADQLYEVGSGWPVVELDAELDGKRAGDIVKFNATIPEALGGDYAGKEVTFQVLVKEVRQKVLPEIDDSFAQTASEFDTLDELRADVATRIEKVKAIQADAEVRNRLLEQLIEDTEVEPPESLVEEEMAFRLRQFEQQLGATGMSLDQYIQQNEFTEDQIEEDLRRNAERNVRAQLILEEIGRREGFNVTEEELRQEIQYHAESMRTDPSELAKQLQDRGRLLALAGDIVRRKALNLLVERADVMEEDAPSEAEPGDAAPKDEEQ
jgi:trigger factor